MKINEFKESDEFQKKEMDEKLSGVELEKIISLSYFVSKRLIFRYYQKNIRLLFSSRSTLTIHI